jgi:hypothetical protein
MSIADIKLKRKTTKDVVIDNAYEEHVISEMKDSTTCGCSIGSSSCTIF